MNLLVCFLQFPSDFMLQEQALCHLCGKQKKRFHYRAMGCQFPALFPEILCTGEAELLWISLNPGLQEVDHAHFRWGTAGSRSYTLVRGEGERRSRKRSWRVRGKSLFSPLEALESADKLESYGRSGCPKGTIKGL